MSSVESQKLSRQMSANFQMPQGFHPFRLQKIQSESLRPLMKAPTQLSEVLDPVEVQSRNSQAQKGLRIKGGVKSAKRHTPMVVGQNFFPEDFF